MALQAVFFLFFVTVSLHGATATLEENCQKIVGPRVTYQSCMTTFQGIPSSNTLDIPGLGVISTNLVVAKAGVIVSRVADILKSSGDDRVKEALKTCSEQYGIIIEDAGVVTKGFQNKDYNTANTYLSAWWDTPNDCDKGFRELKVASPLNDDNSAFRSIVEIPLRISSLLSGN